jgi:hypothetical protein
LTTGIYTLLEEETPRMKLLSIPLSDTIQKYQITNISGRSFKLRTKTINGLQGTLVEHLQ